MDTKTIYDCIVIGGGTSGISFAYYLKKEKKKVLIVEKSKQPGGQVQSISPTVNPDYWFELGSHTCYNSYTSFLSIIKETGNQELIQPLSKFSYVLYSSGKIKSIFSGVSKISMLLHCFKYFTSDKTGKTTREYFRPIVGTKNYEKLFRYAFRAVICQPADDYPAEIFLKKRDKRDESIPRRFTFKNGLSSALDAIIKKEEIEVNTSSEITNIRKIDGIFHLETSDGRVYQAHNIALSANPQISASLLKDLENDLIELLNSIPIFHSESLNVVIHKEKTNLKEVAGVISLSDDFMSVVSRDLVEDSHLRSFTFHFEKGKKSDTEKIDLIGQVLGITESDIIEKTGMNHTLPAMRLEHLHMNEKINSRRKDEAIYILGNYFYGLSLEDCVNRSKLEAKRFFQNNTAND